MHGFEKILTAKTACFFFIILCTLLLFVNYKSISLSLANNVIWYASVYHKKIAWWWFENIGNQVHGKHKSSLKMISVKFTWPQSITYKTIFIYCMFSLMAQSLCFLFTILCIQLVYLDVLLLFIYILFFYVLLIKQFLFIACSPCLLNVYAFFLLFYVFS